MPSRSRRDHEVIPSSPREIVVHLPASHAAQCFSCARGSRSIVSRGRSAGSGLRPCGAGFAFGLGRGSSVSSGGSSSATAAAIGSSDSASRKRRSWFGSIFSDRWP